MRIEREDGIALVTVMLVLAIFLVLALAMLVHGQTEHVVAVNEEDHLKTFAFAEAGVTWVSRRIHDLPPPLTVLSPDELTDLLDGPDGSTTADDNLVGLRDLSLTASSQFTAANEATASAIVLRDFDGQGTKNWELIRVSDGEGRRAHLYVRVDDNWDDDPNDPVNNDPLKNEDKTVMTTVVAEYPVFVETNGAEAPNRFPERGRAIRTLVAAYGRIETPVAAVLANGDIDIDVGGGINVCGECGSVHTNQAIDVGGSPAICGDASATGTYTGSTTGVGGDASGNRPPIPVPVVNPYDDLYVPEPGAFGLFGCPAVSSTNPDTAKYFALVADGGAGQVFKAYWDATNSRWKWGLVDDLNDGANARLDNCGRASLAGADDGDPASFYGFTVTNPAVTLDGCSTCGSAGADASLCTLRNNDFTVNGYYNVSGTLVTGSGAPVLPGSFAPDGQPDFDPDDRIGDAVWEFAGNAVWSPLYGAVIFVYGNVEISGSPASPGSLLFCSASGCVANMPNGMWQVSLISAGDVSISGNPDLGPANANRDYYYQMIAGRDVTISGSPNRLDTACGGACPTTGPTALRSMAGVIAAHEQIRISGDPNLFGYLVAEDALDCSDTVDGQGRGASVFDGNPQIYYDCDNPPSPLIDNGLDLTSWQELY